MAEGGGPRFFGPLFLAENFDVTVAFYRDMLGLPLEGQTPYAECKSEHSLFAIVDARFWSETNGSERPVIRGSTTAPDTVYAVQVPDVDEAFERLMADEVKFLSPPTDRLQMGLRNAFLRDPDGRTIEITSPIRRAAR